MINQYFERNLFFCADRPFARLPPTDSTIRSLAARVRSAKSPALSTDWAGSSLASLVASCPKGWSFSPTHVQERRPNTTLYGEIRALECFLSLYRNNASGKTRPHSSIFPPNAKGSWKQPRKYRRRRPPLMRNVADSTPISLQDRNAAGSTSRVPQQKLRQYPPCAFPPKDTSLRRKTKTLGVCGGFVLSAGKIFVRRVDSTAVRGYCGIRPGDRAHAFPEVLFVIILYLCKNHK